MEKQTEIKKQRKEMKKVITKMEKEIQKKEKVIVQVELLRKISYISLIMITDRSGIWTITNI